MPAERIDVEELAVLQAFAEHLRSELSLPKPAAFLTDQPLDPKVRPGGPYWLAISLGDAMFPEEFQIGGGEAQVMESAEISVTILTEHRLDPAGRADALYAKLLPLRKKVLRAMVATDLLIEQTPFLRQLVPIVRASKIESDPEHHIGWTQLFFRADFDLDLT